MPLVAKVYDKTEGSDGTSLSAAGRAQSIQSTITPIVLYWLLIYQLPNSVLHKIESTCANFFWGGKCHKIALNLLCRPKAGGGIGLRLFIDLKKIVVAEIMVESTC